MEEGTPIFATKEGLVEIVEDEFTKGGPDKSFLELGNYVDLKHVNNEFTTYAHLKKGILVKQGQRVKKGELIGYSGLTGFTTYPHLHFSVFILNSKDEWESVIPRFKKGKKVFTLQSPITKN
ncbi:MAG: M23 family metallopeptidase [Nanoarchaeota archaeon]|nr:M23 family metallopeptidase [Nanoarchaeota archaeon]MBU4351918.1 M23 family metallopeptidase [Nanoarchaeota archaeon]MBU4456955.1 M23 family metallopeptidase [Nanoarchaeota archaeon]